MEQVYKQWKNGKDIRDMEYIRLDIIVTVHFFKIMKMKILRQNT